MNGTAGRRTSPMRATRLLTVIASAALLPLLLFAGCQSGFIYYPRPYGPETVSRWAAARGGRILDYQTGQGRQQAYLQGNLESPRRLWIVCGGNGSLALDWSDWLAEHGPKDDAFLLVDFPGYGNSEGSPTPGRIAESFRAVVPAARNTVGLPAAPDRLRFFGHSLGAAAVMIAASEFRIPRGVLLAPFTSTMDMAREVTGLPVGFLLFHRFDNRERLRELAGTGGQLIIIHGTDDEVIPVSMSRELAEEHPAHVDLIELAGGRHNTIPETRGAELAAAIHKAAR